MKKYFIILVSVFLLFPILCFGKLAVTNEEDYVTVLQESISPEAKGKMYIGIKGITPESDLERLCEMGQAFYEHGIPFGVVLSVLEADVEATRLTYYTQVLNYIQSRGGTILRPSIADHTDAEQVLRNEELNILLQEQGVDMIVMPSTIDVIAFDVLNRLEVSERPFPRLGVDVMIAYALPETSEEVSEIMRQIGDKWLRIDALRPEDDHKVYVFEPEQGKEISLQPAVESKPYSGFFDIGNNMLLIITSVSLLVLSIGIGIGYTIDKEKFYKDNNKEHDI